MDKSRAFDALCKKVADCRLCDRMSESRRVLARSCGNLNAKVMFIGEAPGRLGADGSGVPFHGDKAGHNFEELLRQVHIDRNDIFVTNAVLCNPRDEKGNNAPPSKAEITACADHLRRQIEILDPRIIVTLGSKALDALQKIESHHFVLREHVRRALPWYGRTLIPAYHPGQRAMIHRSFLNQLADYQFIAEHIRRHSKTKRNDAGRLIKPDVLAVTRRMFASTPTLTYFGVHKLFYVIEYFGARELGDRLTHGYIVRQKDGPYCTDLHLYNLKRNLEGLVVKSVDSSLLLQCYRNDLFNFDKEAPNELAEEAAILIDDVMRRYSHFSDYDLKRIVYLTTPMRRILRAEKYERMHMFNSPINFAL